MPTLQGLNGYQEEIVGRRKVIINRTGKGHVHEEIQQPTNFYEVSQQGPQGCTCIRSTCSGPEIYG